MCSKSDEFYKLGRSGQYLYNFGTIFIIFLTKNQKKKQKIWKFYSMWPKSDEFYIQYGGQGVKRRKIYRAEFRQPRRRLGQNYPKKKIMTPGRGAWLFCTECPPSGREILRGMTHKSLYPFIPGQSLVSTHSPVSSLRMYPSRQKQPFMHTAMQSPEALSLSWQVPGQADPHSVNSSLAPQLPAIQWQL